MRPEAGAAADRRVLIVDDENGVRELMARWLEAGGYHVVTAATADEALVRLDQEPSAVALCDIRMPGRDGLLLADRIREQYPETAVIMATGVSEASADAAGRDGIIDYLTKPFGRDRLRDAVQRGLEWHHAAGDSRRWRQTLEQEIDERQSRLAAALTVLPIDSRETADATLALVMGAESDRLSHAHRVADLAVAIGRELTCGRTELAVVRLAGLWHDLGKLAMPEAILRKPAPLDPSEWLLVRRHSSIGSGLAALVPYLAAAAPLIRDATERMDGCGYPRGIAAAATPLGARIVALADAYDTMRHPRVFRGAMTAAAALAEIDRAAGRQFDAGVVAALTRGLKPEP